MVASTDSLAAAAGLSVLRGAGNACDAAVAAAAVLAVTNPQACDLGGDLFAVVQRPGDAVVALCGAGRAGSGADPVQMRCEDLARVPPRGDMRAVTIPGCVDGWLLLHQRYGALPLERILEPAITYAAAGFPASPALAAATSHILHLPDTSDLADPALANRGLLVPGAVIHRPSVAATLTAIASAGREAFYQGAFGESLLDLSLGLFGRSDLARLQAEWVEPIHVRAWGHEVWTPPPTFHGHHVLAGLSELAGEPADLVAAADERPPRLQPTPDGTDDARQHLPQVGASRHGGDTAALAVVDGDRMAVSLMQSLGSPFGAHIVEPATTIFLQNRGTAFSLEPGHPAELRPGRRPPHTLAPTLVTHTDGSLRAALGTADGDDQSGILLDLLARTLDPEASPLEPSADGDADGDGNGDPEVRSQAVVITADGGTLHGAVQPPWSTGAVESLSPQRVE